MEWNVFFSQQLFCSFGKLMETNASVKWSNAVDAADRDYAEKC